MKELTRKSDHVTDLFFFPFPIDFLICRSRSLVLLSALWISDSDLSVLFTFFVCSVITSSTPLHMGAKVSNDVTKGAIHEIEQLTWS